MLSVCVHFILTISSVAHALNNKQLLTSHGTRLLGYVHAIPPDERTQRLRPLAVDSSPFSVNDDIIRPEPSALRRIANVLGWFIEIPSEEPWADKYWADPRIHSFGNLGTWGAMHAGIAPFFTWMLDQVAYEGLNLRHRAAADLLKERRSRGLATKRIVDLGCGTGPTARAMAAAFKHQGVEVVGVDTSPEMLRVAQVLTSETSGFHTGGGDTIFGIGDADNYWTGGSSVTQGDDRRCRQNTITYLRANAEDTALEEGTFDIVCATFLLHEVPAKGRAAILAEARRLLAPGGTFLMLDIARDYLPSPVMKSGEPYIEGYLQHIENDITGAGFAEVSCLQPVPGRAEQWIAHEPTEHKARELRKVDRMAMRGSGRPVAA